MKKMFELKKRNLNCTKTLLLDAQLGRALGLSARLPTDIYLCPPLSVLPREVEREHGEKHPGTWFFTCVCSALFVIKSHNTQRGSLRATAQRSATRELRTGTHVFSHQKTTKMTLLLSLTDLQKQIPH